MGLDYNMRMRYQISLLLIISLTFASPALASVTPKPGAVCTKKGKVQIQSNKSYTCIKSGSRLVWSKGVALSSQTSKTQPKSTPSISATPPILTTTSSPTSTVGSNPTPTASPSPSPSPTPSPVSTTPAIGRSGNYVYRYVQGLQQRKNIDGKWIDGDSRAAEDFDPIRVAAYRSINSLQVDPDHSNIKIEFIIRASFPNEIAEAMKLQVISAARYMSPLFDSKATIKVVALTEKDQVFADQELPGIIPRNSYGNSLDILKDYGTLERFYSRGGTGGGSAGYLEQLGYGFYLAHTSSLATLETYWPEVAPHEMAHFLQGFLARGAVNNFGEGNPESKWHGHLIEGSANSLGMALGFANLGWYSDEMDKLLKRNINYFSKRVTVNSPQDAVNLITEIERRDNEVRNELSYAAGQIVWEYYIGKYGVQKFIELLKNVPKTSNFNENLRLTIGKDKAAFYGEAGEYLFAQWSRLSK